MMIESIVFLILAVLLAVGFALLPTCIFFFFETPAPTGGI